jgi:hypothetical protein
VWTRLGRDLIVAFIGFSKLKTAMLQIVDATICIAIKKTDRHIKTNRSGMN